MGGTTSETYKFHYVKIYVYKYVCVYLCKAGMPSKHIFIYPNIFMHVNKDTSSGNVLIFYIPVLYVHFHPTIKQIENIKMQLYINLVKISCSIFDIY